ncbi:hypothetical protein KEM55_008082 [Ascosphaera atra]|nr:hypothetical protein KEM55_008082 [Ascosphaera atra]
MSLKRKREDEPDDTPQEQQPPHKPSYPDKKTAKQVKKLYAFIDSSAKSSCPGVRKAETRAPTEECQAGRCAGSGEAVGEA